MPSFALSSSSRPPPARLSSSSLVVVEGGLYDEAVLAMRAFAELRCTAFIPPWKTKKREEEEEEGEA